MHRRLFFFFSVFIFLLSSCSEYTQVLKSKDVQYKTEWAEKLYDEGEYVKALPLLEELITYYRGTDKAERIYYLHAFCNYQLSYYYLASFYFENFTKTFPNSTYAEECDFMAAYCYYKNSPRFSKDQTDTDRAIEAMNLFVNKHPESELLDSCNHIIDELRGKLEDKAFNDAYLYYKTLKYKSAIVAFKYLLKDYPSTIHREKVFYYITKSNYLLASNSVESKKKERFDNTIEAYFNYIDRFPEGRYKKELESIYNSSRNQVEKM